MILKKAHWFWNVLLVITSIICALALTLHYKNWLTNNATHLKVRSGFYHISKPHAQLDSVYFADRIPKMERLNGFSALEQEKGTFRAFKDSLLDKKVYVFVDNINQQKIKLVYKDSLLVYLNLKDSIASVELMEDLKIKMNSVEAIN